MKKTYYTQCWGETYAIRADWSQSSSPIDLRCEEDRTWDSTAWQVADFAGPTEAMAAILRQSMTDGGIERDERIEREVSEAAQAIYS